MSNRLRQCIRVAQVRTVQHGLAALASAQAARRVEALESSETQLARLREGFGAEPGESSGAVLASLGELAMRLDMAREGLSRTIAGARAQATTCVELQRVARRREESMKKLAERTSADVARTAEHKPLPAQRGRRALPAPEPRS